MGTYRACPKNKNKSNQSKDNPKDTKKDGKTPLKLKPKGGKIRSVKNDEQSDEVPEGEENEDDDNNLVLYGLRLKWWPHGVETDDDLESSSESEVFYLDEGDEVDTDSSGDESGYFTPPNSPAGLLSVEDYMTEDEDEPLHPPLLSDSEGSDSEEDEDSEDDENDSPIRRYLNNITNSYVARGGEDQISPGARVWTENSPQDNLRVEYQEVTAELLMNFLGINGLE